MVCPALVSFFSTLMSQFRAARGAGNTRRYKALRANNNQQPFPSSEHIPGGGGSPQMYIPGFAGSLMHCPAQQSIPEVHESPWSWITGRPCPAFFATICSTLLTVKSSVPASATMRLPVGESKPQLSPAMMVVAPQMADSFLPSSGHAGSMHPAPSHWNWRLFH